MSDPKPTPLPWRYYAGTRSIWTDAPEAGRGAESICVMAGPRQRSDSSKQDANAEFILRTCSSHADLVEALREIIALSDSEMRDGDGAREIAQRALAKMEGKP